MDKSSVQTSNNQDKMIIDVDSSLSIAEENWRDHFDRQMITVDEDHNDDDDDDVSEDDDDDNKDEDDDDDDESVIAIGTIQSTPAGQDSNKDQENILNLDQDPDDIFNSKAIKELSELNLKPKDNSEIKDSVKLRVGNYMCTFSTFYYSGQNNTPPSNSAKCSRFIDLNHAGDPNYKLFKYEVLGAIIISKKNRKKLKQVRIYLIHI